MSVVTLVICVVVFYITVPPLIGLAVKFSHNSINYGLFPPRFILYEATLTYTYLHGNV